MIILDLYSNDVPIYSRTNSYFGKPFIWNTLLDFGGNSGILGDLSIVGNSMASTLKNTTVVGVGITMEGIWTNYIMFDLTLKMALENTTVDIDSWVSKYAMRRYGLPFSIVNPTVDTKQEAQTETVHLSQKAWNILQNGVYNTPGGIPKSLIVVTPSLSLGTNNNNNSDSTKKNNKNKIHRWGYDKYRHEEATDKLLYNVMDVQNGWQPFIEMGIWLQNVSQYKIDLIDITRQSLSDLFSKYYTNLTNYYSDKNETGVAYCKTKMLDILTDLNNVLNTDSDWMLGPWLNMARNQAINVTVNETVQADWYEFNARNQLTLWGPTHNELCDYASKVE